MSRNQHDDVMAMIGIATRNRYETAQTAIESAQAQEPPGEVIFVDDAPDDGTSEMIRRRFPTVRLIRSEQRIGLIEGRMRIFREATTPIVCIIDGDATFSTPAVVRQRSPILIIRVSRVWPSCCSSAVVSDRESRPLQTSV
jgi:glycosyltransferase involved in cell wall biosynthesis